jgi:hypothetical protein
MFLHSTTVTLEPSESRPWAILANLYCTAELDPELDQPRSDALTLIFFHGTGLCKETWEPTLEGVFGTAPQGLIKDAWCIEYPDNGESGVINEQRLAGRDLDNCGSLLAAAPEMINPFDW